jgi:hypothetical protein
MYTCDCACLSVSPYSTIAKRSRSARPIPAEPAPREQVLFVSQLAAFEFGGIDHAGEHDAEGRRLVERRVPQQIDPTLVGVYVSSPLASRN